MLILKIFLTKNCQYLILLKKKAIINKTNYANWELFLY